MYFPQNDTGNALLHKVPLDGQETKATLYNKWMKNCIADCWCAQSMLGDNCTSSYSTWGGIFERRRNILFKHKYRIGRNHSKNNDLCFPAINSSNMDVDKIRSTLSVKTSLQGRGLRLYCKVRACAVFMVPFLKTEFAPNNIDFNHFYDV